MRAYRLLGHGLLLALTAACGCRQGGVVEVDVTVDPSITNIQKVKAHATSGDRVRDLELPYQAPPAGQPFSFAISYDFSGTMNVTVTLSDGSRDLGHGSGSATLVPQGVSPRIAINVGAGSNQPCNGALLCESFATLDPGVWSKNESGGSVAIDSNFGHDDHSSLKVHINGGAAMPAVSVVETKFVPTSTVYLRAFVNFGATVPNLAMALLFYENDKGEQTAITVEQNVYSFYDQLDGNSHKSSSVAPTPGTWTCLEWMVQLGASGATQLSVDGKVAFSGAAKIQPMNPFNQLGVGLASSATAAGAIDLWFDDVAVDTKPIGCN